MNLEVLGWNPYFEEQFKHYKEEGYIAGRVYVEHKHAYGIYTEFGELRGEISGKLRYNAESSEDFPSVGDWVAISPRFDEGRATIHCILPRKSKFSRKIAGENTEEQVVAANIDTVFLVNSLNRNFNLRRMERYLIMAWESGASPVIVLSKADACDDVEQKLSKAEEVAIGTPVHAISSVTGQGIEELKDYFKEGSTVALLGSSGVGKSTLINCLAGIEIQETGDIREDDDKGRHTTTYRELIVLPSGGLIIDTPGMRELQLWNGDEGLSGTFEDIEILASHCYFKDCRHRNEPRCAVKQAVAEGIISSERLESYNRLQRELRFLEHKQTQAARISSRRSGKEKPREKPSSRFEVEI